jgi:hypothetical protein
MKRFVPLAILCFFLAGMTALRAQLPVINEFMFAPAAGNAEWVELFNPSSEAVNLRGWTLTDRARGTALISEEDFLLQPDSYVLVAQALPLAPGWESPPAPVLLPGFFPSLNNSGDDIILRDAEGTAVDSLTYAASWSPKRGVSAERIRWDSAPVKTNWSPSSASAGGTPGERNTASSMITDPQPRFVILFNELMPAPLPSSCEWIELYNAGSEEYHLGGWAIAGRPNSSGIRTTITFPAADAMLRPGGLAIVAADSTIIDAFPHLGDQADAIVMILGRSSLGLGNSGDELLLLDPTGTVIDSIWYSESWHHPMLAGSTGISLELMQPGYHHLGADAWSSCSEPSGGTPGRRNSIYSEMPPGSAASDVTLTVSPNPFSPDGDGHEDYCMFRCKLPEHVNQIRLRLYDAEGRVVTTLRNNVPMGREGLVVWNGLDDAGRRARIGCYVALLEGLDPYSNSVVAARAVVVVARRL